MSAITPPGDTGQAVREAKDAFKAEENRARQIRLGTIPNPEEEEEGKPKPKRTRKPK